MQIGHFLLERPLPLFSRAQKRTCHHCIPSSLRKLYNNEAAPKGCLALAQNTLQRGYFAAIWEDQPRDDRGSGLSVVGTMRSVWTTSGWFASDLHICAKTSFPCRCRRHFSQRRLQLLPNRNKRFPAVARNVALLQVPTFSHCGHRLVGYGQMTLNNLGD
jgi:hypothetical protein